MTVNVDLKSVMPQVNSGRGARMSDSNKQLRTLGIAMPWSLALTDTPDVALNGLPTLFGGTLLRTASDPTAGGIYDDSAVAGDKFTDDIADIVDAGTADILFMLASTGEAVGDKFILGFDKDGGLPVSINITLSTAGVGGAGDWQYLSRAGYWKNFDEVVDESTDLTAGTSNYDVVWQIPNDWMPMVEDEIDGVARWYIAFNITTVFSTNPVGSDITAVCLAPGNISGGFVAPSTGLIDYLQYKATASGSAADTILQVYNWTRRTRGLVTLTAEVAQARVAFTTPLYVQRGDELSIAAVQGDGTNEFTAFDQLMFEIAL